MYIFRIWLFGYLLFSAKIKMGRTQLNINIDPELFDELKKHAIMSGKTISSFVSESLSRQLDNISPETIESKLNGLEKRIQSIELMLTSTDTSGVKITPFTSQEAQRYNEFTKAVFAEEIKKKSYKSSKDAWDDFIPHVECFDQWNDFYTLRLKEVIFIEHGNPITNDEMNILAKDKICPAPIRTGLINWIKNSEKGVCSCSCKDFPSQKEICKEGSRLVRELYPRV